MKPTTSREFQYLATAVAIIVGFYASHASLSLGRFAETFAIMGVDADANTPAHWMLRNTRAVTLAVIALTLVTLTSIWIKRRGHALIAYIGILLLGLSSHTIYQAAFDPMLKMIYTVDEQG